MTRALFDAAAFVYAAGSDHPHREPSRALVRVLAGGLVAEAAAALA